jgi:tetratricopeptide (TPR) repeat protein
MDHAPRLGRPALLTLLILGAGAIAAQSAAAATAVTAAAAAPTDTPPPFGAYLGGRFADDQGDFSTAATDFLSALASNPMDPALLTQAFMASLMSNRPETLALAAKLPDNEVAQLVLADQDALSSQWDAAEQRFVNLPSQGVAQIVQPVLIAWAQQGAGRTESALATLSQMMQREPRLTSIYALHAGMIADLAGRAADADRFYSMAQGGETVGNLRAAQILASWQARQGRRGVAEATLGALASTNGEFGLVLPGLTRDMAARPVPDANDGIAEAYLAFAAALREQGASDYALVLLHLALDLRPDLSAARLLMAEIQGDLGQPQQAVAMLDSVPAHDPLAPIAQLHRAELAARLGHVDEAAKSLEQLAHAFPERPEPLEELGDLMRADKRWPAAISAYDRSLALIPHPNMKDWGLYYSRGIAYDRAHQWPKAQADFEHALQLAPDQPYVLNYLAYAWTEQGHNLEQARQMLQKAVALDPNDGAIVDSLGWVLLRLNDGPAAVRELEHAVELEPEDPTINGHLGDAYWHVGRKLEAQFQWRRALDLNPEPDDVAKLEAKLRGVPEAPPGRQGASAAQPHIP